MNRPRALSEPSPKSTFHPQFGVAAEQGVRGYVWAAAAAVATTVVSDLLSAHVRLTELVMINLLPVIAISTRFGVGPSVLTAALTVLSVDYFFIPPVYAFAPSDLQSLVTLVVMILVAGVISGLSESARRQRATAASRMLQVNTERLRTSLLSAVSHDLRTPLATISGAGEVLRDDMNLGAEARHELAEAIVEETARLSQLVTNLLDLARLDGGPLDLKKRAEPLDEVVEAALSRLHGRFGHRPVRSYVPQEIPMVPMDAVLMQQVLVNLLENAIRYTSEKSPVEVEARTAGDHVAIEVRDFGPGIREEEADRLFDLFYRGSAAGPRDGGAGLGLTICRAIVQAHGGTIAIHNRPEGGAVARFTLPIGAEQGAPA